MNPATQFTGMRSAVTDPMGNFTLAERLDLPQDSSVRWRNFVRVQKRVSPVTVDSLFSKSTWANAAMSDNSSPATEHGNGCVGQLCIWSSGFTPWFRGFLSVQRVFCPLRILVLEELWVKVKCSSRRCLPPGRSRPGYVLLCLFCFVLSEELEVIFTQGKTRNLWINSSGSHERGGQHLILDFQGFWLPGTRCTYSPVHCSGLWPLPHLHLAALGIQKISANRASTLLKDEEKQLPFTFFGFPTSWIKQGFVSSVSPHLVIWSTGDKSIGFWGVLFE